MKQRTLFRYPFATTDSFRIWWVMAAMILGVGVSMSCAEDDRFTVFGWMKHQVSPAEASRSARMRPVTAAAQPSGPAFAPGPRGPATVSELRRRAEFLATRGLSYKFGGDHPTEGGMDCSGTMQFLLKSIGYADIPRTSYAQFEWLQRQGTLRKVGFFRSPERAISDFRPGDLIFWGGTYDSGHKVSHVMVYLGRSPAGTHFVFGARGKKTRGLNGNGVDIFEFKPESTGGRLVGYGSLPGLRKG